MKKTYLALAISIVVMAGPIVYQNCDGTRKRSTNLSVAWSTIDSQLASLQALAANDADMSSALSSFLKLKNEPDSTLFYSEAGAGSSLGDIPFVMPLDISKFAGGTAVAATTKRYAYFVVVNHQDGMRGALILAGDGQAATPAPQAPAPAPSSTPDTSNPLAPTDPFAQPVSFSAATADVTPTSTPGAATPGFAYVMINDGATMKAQSQPAAVIIPAEISDTDFALELAYKNNFDVVVRSDDVVNNDLADTIQLQVYSVDSNGEGLLGLLNMVQPGQ